MSSFVPISKVVKSTDGVSIYSDAIGDPTKPSIVFIHGICMSGACFDNLFADSNLLAKFYLVRLLSYVSLCDFTSHHPIRCGTIYVDMGEAGNLPLPKATHRLSSPTILRR